MTLFCDIAYPNPAGKGVQRINRVIVIDLLTPEQRRYLTSWREGT